MKRTDREREREREGENQGKLAKNTSTEKIVHAKMLRIKTHGEFVALLCTRSSPPEHLTQDSKGLQFKLSCTVNILVPTGVCLTCTYKIENFG